MNDEMYYAYGIVPNTKTRVRCVYCGVFIPKAVKCIEEHIDGIKHRENKKLVKENGIVYILDQGLYCKLCCVFIAEKDSIIQHLQMATHANWLVTMEDLIDGEFINVDRFLADKSDNAFCAACEKNIPCSLENVEEHINSDDHHANFVESLKPLNGLFAGEGLERLWCKICHVYLDDTLPAIIDHIENDEHSDWIVKMVYHTEVNGIFIGNYLAHEFENKAYCFKCKAEILCSVDSVDFHVQTDAHMNSVLPEFSDN